MMTNPFAVVQDFYKSLLEKRAYEDTDKAITPDYALDSREIALKEVDRNKEIQRKDLSELLSAAKKESKADTATMDKALPEATEKSDTDTSNPLLKIAMNMAFFEGLRHVNMLKTASADYMKTVYSSFNDELEKILQ